MSSPRPARYAAGRARALGLPTRGTTAPNRLRRVDRHVVDVHAGRLRAAVRPLVVDLGYGASPVTTVELHRRLLLVRPDVEVVGLEIDQVRVQAAQAGTTDGLSFRRGGFELAGLRPVLVRAFNILRQYDRQAAADAWTLMAAHLQDDGVLVEGTCDELGRRAAWVTLTRNGPQTLTLAAHLPTLDRPSDIAPRLPKSLIHDNVPQTGVWSLLAALDDAWDRCAPYAAYGNRQRWRAMCKVLAWQQVGRRDGEVTVPWSTVAPA